MEVVEALRDDASLEEVVMWVVWRSYGLPPLLVHPMLLDCKHDAAKPLGLLSPCSAYHDMLCSLAVTQNRPFLSC